ncbi:MAG: hypothetical protein PHE02_06720 [Lachnospiraceae bacterium]|nr:hypothetical protein [Lachnospiraceae bacterium]
MSKLILCQGTYALTPYWIERGEIHIFSVEELCYYIRENVVLIDQDLMCVELTRWLAEECKLPELGESLSSCIQEKAEFTVFVKRLFQYTRYCTTEELDGILQQIVENAQMNTWEKRKNRIDFYYKSGKYMVALREYATLKRDLGTDDIQLSAKISNNMAAIYAHFYNFQMAAVEYLRAYQEDAQEDYFFAYLAAKRMLLTEKEYIDFVAQEVQHYDISLQLEKTIENLNGLWEDSEDKHRLEQLSESRNGQKMNAYYETVEQLTSQWKDAYREHLSNGYH